MTKPIGVEVDLESKSGYVAYSDRRIAETHEVWDEGTIAADVDAGGEIVGIEMLQLDRDTLSRARRYAEEHDLIFPAMLDLAAP